MAIKRDAVFESFCEQARGMLGNDLDSNWVICFSVVSHLCTFLFSYRTIVDYRFPN